MIYGILSTIIFILILPFWLIIGIFKPKVVAGFKEKLGLYRKSDLPARGKKNIVFYGVSVGEVIAMENLIKKTRETFPLLTITLLTGTKTGQEIANKKLAQSCDYISYFPFDFPFCIRNFIKKLSPCAVFVMETELWPNFARVMNKNKIPLYIINGRISDRTYKSYKKLSFFFKSVLKNYTAIFTQSKQDNEKLISIGANPQTTSIMGNLKFDIKKPQTENLEFNYSPHYKTIVAGSTHRGEDEIILEAFSQLKKALPVLKLVIAPRHPERNGDVLELAKKTGLPVGKRSSRDNFDNCDIILLDTMGELGKFYSVCDVAFIGGSFNKKGKGVGGHNPLEATIFNKPVVSGPSVHNFKDIYAILTSSGAGKVVKTPEELKENLKKLLSDPGYYKKAALDCKEVFEQNQGALNFVMNVLQSLV